MTTEVKDGTKRINFREGILYIVSQEEAETRGRVNELRYGMEERTDHQNFPYFVPLGDLIKIEEARIPWLYHTINEHTEARKTLDGGLKVRRATNRRSTKTSSFSRSEYESIRNNF